MEGLSEAVGRDRTGLSHAQFLKKLKTRPQTSLQELTEGFWQVDTAPTAQNLAYQYSRHFLTFIAPRINEKLAIRDDVAPTYKLEGCYWILHQVAHAFTRGIRLTVTDVMADMLGISPNDLKNWKREWRQSL